MSFYLTGLGFDFGFGGFVFGVVFFAIASGSSGPVQTYLLNFRNALRLHNIQLLANNMHYYLLETGIFNSPVMQFLGVVYVSLFFKLTPTYKLPGKSPHCY